MKHLQPIRLDEGEPVSKPGAEPKWNRLFPMGATRFRDDFPGGKITFSREWCEALVANAKALITQKGHKIQANYHHFGGCDVNPGAALESTVAAGWIQDVELRADGPYALIAWTDRARKFIEAEELAYLSPEFALNYPNRDTGKSQGPTLLGVALTNVPFLKDLSRVAATDDTTTPTPAPAEGEHMDPKKLRKLLNLSEAATDAEVEAALLSSAANGEKLSIALADREGALKLAEMQAVATKATEEVKSLTMKLAERDAKDAAAAVLAKETEAKAFVSGLVKEMRITPAMSEAATKLALSDLASAKAVFGDLKPAAGELGHGGGSGAPVDARKALTAAATAISKERGISMSDAREIAILTHQDLAKAATPAAVSVGAEVKA